MINPFSILEYIIEAIFPKKCVGCQKKHTDLCVSCFKKIPRAQNPEYNFIHARFDYRDSRIRTLIKKLKYKNAQRIAGIFGCELYDELIGVLGDKLGASSNQNILLAPIPLHPRRMRERGYNQSELIARAIKKVDSSNIFTLLPKVLARTRNTNTQAQKERRIDRFKNLSHAFVCPDRNLIQGNIVILIDDVTTTGATLKDARRALLEAGAQEVHALTIAH